jgi:NitT/TauT family transport system ATP-binding protein
VSPPTTDKLTTILARGDWDRAVALLERLDPAVASALFLDLPFESQAAVFQRLSIPVAAALVEAFPYYHAYVLLHSRPRPDLIAIVNAMRPAERLRFFDELPQETWQRLMDELSEERPAAEARPGPAGLAPEVRLAPAEPILEALRIEKSFTRPGGGKVQVIAPTDLAIEPEMIVALLGPSGSGKSTLLRILSGLTTPSAGTVLWHGKPLSVARPSVAIVFQSFALFPWLTVAGNVEAALQARGLAREERRRRALEVLGAVGLKGFETAYPKELSGGMKQRVGFARALVVEPEILFMDEPFSALDVLTAENLRGELMELWLEKKVPMRSIFLVTHNIEEAVLLADRILVLGRNPARIRADFHVALPQPRVRTAPEFLLYVDYIYKMLTQPQLEGPPPTAPAKEAKPRFPMLPHARRGAIAGLLELLNDRGGKDDLYQISDELRLEIDDLLPIIEAAVLLEFAVSDRGDVEITPQGKAFAEADIAGRKQLFREAALAHVALLQQMNQCVASKSDHAMPLEFFRDILREHFSDQEMERQIDTALNWGRYADLFTYDSESGRIIAESKPNDSAH